MEKNNRDAKRLKLLEEKYAGGDISKETYQQLKEKYTKQQQYTSQYFPPPQYPLPSPPPPQYMQKPPYPPSPQPKKYRDVIALVSIIVVVILIVAVLYTFLVTEKTYTAEQYWTGIFDGSISKDDKVTIVDTIERINYTGNYTGGFTYVKCKSTGSSPGFARYYGSEGLSYPYTDPEYAWWDFISSADFSNYQKGDKVKMTVRHFVVLSMEYA